MIRYAIPEDAKSISDIRINGWKSAYRGIVEDEYLNNMDYENGYNRFYERLSNKKDNERIVVYEDENKNILGFAVFVNLSDPEYDCELQGLYIEPNNKGKGIGSQLMNYVISYFKNNNKKTMIVYCLKENHDSRKFYEKHNGILCGEEDKEIGGNILRVVGYKYNL